MINSKRAKLAAIACLILVFVTVILFMRLFPGQESSRMTALAFVVVGISLPVIGYIRVEDTSARLMGPGLRIGLYSLFLIYGLSAVSLAVALMLMGFSAGLIATLEIVLALVFGVVFIFAVVTGGERVRSRTRTMESVAFMRALEEDVFLLSREGSGKKYNERLRRISEAVKYSDYSGLTSMDADLAEKIRELKYVLREADEFDNREVGEFDYREVGGGTRDNAGAPGVAGRSGVASRSGVSGVSSQTGATGALSEELLDKQVELITEDILRLIQDRNRELLNEKRNRSLSHG